MRYGRQHSQNSRTGRKSQTIGVGSITAKIEIIDTDGVERSGVCEEGESPIKARCVDEIGDQSSGSIFHLKHAIDVRAQPSGHQVHGDQLILFCLQFVTIHFRESAQATGDSDRQCVEPLWQIARSVFGDFMTAAHIKQSGL